MVSSAVLCAPSVLCWAVLRVLPSHDPQTEPAYGADVLRLWVSSVDYSSDVSIGPGILRQIADVYRKLRGTLRFMLGNLDGFQVLHP